jgi:hypothetical protein
MKWPYTLKVDCHKKCNSLSGLAKFDVPGDPKNHSHMLIQRVIYGRSGVHRLVFSAHALSTFWCRQALILGSQSTYASSSIPCDWEMSQVLGRKLEIFIGRYDSRRYIPRHVHLGTIHMLADSTSVQLLGPSSYWSFNISCTMDNNFVYSKLVPYINSARSVA